MNFWQVVRQIQYLLRAAVWPGSSTVVWDTASVKVIEQGQEDIALDEDLIPPMAIISPGPGQVDPVGRGEAGRLVERTLTITLIAVSQGDRVGEAAMVGAQRYGATDSRNRGVMELEPSLASALNLLTSVNGIVIASAGYGMSAVRRAGDYWVAMQDYEYKVYCTSEKFYHPPRKITAQSKTGEIDLAWQVPPDRWDRYRVRLVRKAGSTPPVSVSDGTVVTLAANLSTSKNDTGLVPGTYSYSLFASYSEFDTSPQVDDAYSDPATIAGAVAF